MLGLLSALCRRERLETVQKLDALVASTLRPFSHAHQREAGFALMQRQAEAMPALVERLEAMIAAIERQGATLGERQLAGQQAFIEQAEASHTRLAAMLGETLTRSAADSARAAGAAIVPVVEAAMAGLAQESGKLHGTLMQAVDRQLDGLTAGFETNTARVAGIWNEALAEHRRSGEALAGELRGALEGFNSSFENRSAALLREVEKRQALAAESASQAWAACSRVTRPAARNSPTTTARRSAPRPPPSRPMPARCCGNCAPRKASCRPAWPNATRRAWRPGPARWPR